MDRSKWLIEYARLADDLIVLIDRFRKWEWLLKAVYKRLVEEFEKLHVRPHVETSELDDEGWKVTPAKGPQEARPLVTLPLFIE